MCTRVVYPGGGERILTARSMDWNEDLRTNLWALPCGMARDGAAGPDPFAWTSTYGSVVATGYDVSTTDGINEAGLVANALWLVESQYPSPDDPRPQMSLSVWTQYVLDSFATVADAVATLSKEEFAVVAPGVPGQAQQSAAHLAVSDASGDSAIFEYLGGQLVIHHDRSYRVMTNSPPYDQQLAIEAYWQEVGGTVMLPGTNRAADRYVRASFYVGAVPHVDDRETATAAALSVIRNTSVPYGLSTPDHPNLSSTLWRAVADHLDRRYFFDSVLSPSVIWVALDDLDLGEGAPVRKLAVSGAPFGSLTGDVAEAFEAAEPFVFLGAAPPEEPGGGAA